MFDFLKRKKKRYVAGTTSELYSSSGDWPTVTTAIEPGHSTTHHFGDFSGGESGGGGASGDFTCDTGPGDVGGDGGGGCDSGGGDGGE